MKTLIVLGSVVITLVLVSPSIFTAQHQNAFSQTNRNVVVADSGYYVMLSRCRACALTRQEQQDVMMAFRGRSFSAFYGEEKYNSSYDKIESIKKLSGVQTFPFALFVGPFQDEGEANNVISEIPTILRKQIDEDKAENQKQVNRGFAVKLSPEQTTGFFEVRLVKLGNQTTAAETLTGNTLNIGILEENANYYDAIDWCYFKSSTSSKANIFFINSDDTPYRLWLNIDGTTTSLKLVSSTRSTLKRLRAGSSYKERYRSGNVIADISYVVVKQYPEGAALAATVVVTKGNRHKTVKTVCECG